MGVLKDQKGMSLVEMIIVIAVVAILASVAFGMSGYIRYANTGQAAEKIDKALSSQQLNTMSKAEDTYLYFYKLDDGIYMKKLAEKLDTFDDTKLDADGTKIAGNTVGLYLDDKTAKLEAGINFIRIRYKKNGMFDGDTNVNKIIVSGSSDYTVTLVTETGKHFVEKE